MSVPTRLLVVEDNRDALAILTFMLKKRGYDVVQATGVGGAIEAGSTNSFDLLICDIGLPDGDGTEVLNALRKQKDFPAIALTARATLVDVEEQIEAGFDLHVSKPFTFTYLEDAISKLLQLREASGGTPSA